jgi:hypothetical protein
MGAGPAGDRRGTPPLNPLRTLTLVAAHGKTPMIRAATLLATLALSLTAAQAQGSGPSSGGTATPPPNQGTSSTSAPVTSGTGQQGPTTVQGAGQTPGTTSETNATQRPAGEKGPLPGVTGRGPQPNR